MMRRNVAAQRAGPRDKRDMRNPQNHPGEAAGFNSTPLRNSSIIIRPPGGWIKPELKELVLYKDLIYLLAWRDIRIRYKQTIIGTAWVVLQPIVTVLIFTVLFGELAKIPSGSIPYPIFAFSALVPWTFFVHALTKLTHCLVSQQDVLKKVYFPRLVIPIAAVLAAFIDFAIAFCILIVMMFCYGIAPTAAVVALPFFVLLTVATALGIGLWLAALHVEYRDVGNALPFVIQTWLFITPVAYPSSMIPKHWQAVYALNPMAGVVEGFRWALFGTERLSGSVLWISISAVVIILIGGIYFFRWKEDRFADIV